MNIQPLTSSVVKKLAAVLGLAVALCACQPAAQTQSPNESKAMDIPKTKSIVMNVALFGYQNRPIHDVYLNGVDIGVSAGQPFRGNPGMMTGVKVTLGPQVVTWTLGGPKGMPSNGETVKSINQPVFKEPGKDSNYLGVHIYPDNTVELVPAKFWPEKTEKGLEINRQWEQKHGK